MIRCPCHSIWVSNFLKPLKFKLRTTIIIVEKEVKSYSVTLIREILDGFGGFLLGPHSRDVMCQSFLPFLESQLSKDESSPSHYDTIILMLLAGLWGQDVSMVRRAMALIVDSENMLQQKSSCRLTTTHWPLSLGDKLSLSCHIN